MNDENDRNDNDWGMTMPHMRFEKDKNVEDFSDDFAPQSPPGDQSPANEWGVTQQNFNLPNNQPSSSDFDKTTPNVNIPENVWRDVNQSTAPQNAADDWGMTQQNFVIPNNEKADDWGMITPKDNIPQASKEDDWEPVPQNVSVPKQDNDPAGWSMPAPVFRISEGEKIDNLSKRTSGANQPETDGFDKTTPSFNLSNVSNARHYSASAPVAAASRTAEPPVNQPVAETQKLEKSGSSKLIYALGGLILLLFFGVVALAGVYFLYLDKPQTAQLTETKKDQLPETASSTVPVAAPTAETILPKEIDYKGAMVLVSAGEFTMGSNTDAEESKPAHKITLPAFYIDKTEVSNAEYKKFCDETGKSYPSDPHLEKGYFTNRPNAPVVGVSFADAKAYASWAGKRLPTEEEWEKAASWDESAKAKRIFPWGNDFQKNNVAFGLNSISDVGKFSGGASSYGAVDMAGNVLEWVDAFFQPYPNNTVTNPEYGEKNRVVRGGHFGSKTNDSLKTTKRIYVSPDIASGEDDQKLIAAIIGFRCAVSVDDSAVKSVLNAQSK